MLFWQALPQRQARFFFTPSNLSRPDFKVTFECRSWWHSSQHSSIIQKPPVSHPIYSFSRRNQGALQRARHQHACISYRKIPFFLKVFALKSYEHLKVANQSLVSSNCLVTLSSLEAGLIASFLSQPFYILKTRLLLSVKNYVTLIIRNTVPNI